jgi:hypothetical protein
LLDVKDQIAAKTNEKQELEKEIEKIRRARQELELLGATSLQSFKACVQILAGYWQTTIKDAREIQTWLDEGAKDAVRTNSSGSLGLAL